MPLDHLRQVWPDVRIILRADSGFCRWRLMRWCDRNGVGYILGLARNNVLERLAGPWIHAAQTCFDMTGEPQLILVNRTGCAAFRAGAAERLIRS